VPVEELAEVLAGGGASPLAAALRDERDRVVRGLLRELPAETRRMFALRFEQDLRYREIAACMGLTANAVKQRFSRALRDLKSRLATRPGEKCEVDDVS
jgi:RNA polymerase sigma-70 factor (ECF subfamily)